MKKLDDRIYIIDNLLDENFLYKIQNFVYDCNDWTFGQTNPSLNNQLLDIERNMHINEEKGLLPHDIERAWYKKLDNCNSPIHFWRNDIFSGDYEKGFSGGKEWNKWKYKNKNTNYKNIILLEELIRKKSENILTNYEPTLIYLNGQTSGQCGGIHQDINAPSKYEWSVLFFPMPWKINQGGELIIYEKNYTDIKYAIHPMENRLIIFDGSHYHQGTSPNLNTNKMRISLSYKMNRLPNND